MNGAGLRLLSMASLVSVTFAGCGGAGGGSPASPSTTTSNAISVNGVVYDRISGAEGDIDGSTVTFRTNAGGQPDGTTTVQRGRFQLTVPSAGVYVVDITGPAHVDYQRLNVGVTSGATLRFGVLKWGSGGFGVAYDSTFHSFFDWVRRGFGDKRLWKWDLAAGPPRTIYVDTDVLNTTTYTFAPLDSATLGWYLQVIRSINATLLPDMFCQRVQPLPIVTGPTRMQCQAGRTPPCSVVDEAGYIYIHLHESGRSHAGANSNSTTIFGGSISIERNALPFHGVEYPGDMERAVFTIAHELYHVAGASHPGDAYSYPASLMSYSFPAAALLTVLPPWDRLASCIAYNDGTAGGNSWPDKNPF
jgi:hypothetical protein